MTTNNLSSTTILGVDTGGTFTDFVLYQKQHLSIYKVLSTPHAPEQAILQGIEALGLTQQLAELTIVHGSTVATNAVLEKKGVKTVYITNTGLADILTIGRQARKSLYDLTPRPEPPPVPFELCYEVNSRVDAKAQVLSSLNNKDLQQLSDFIKQHQPKSIAINLLFSFLNNDDEIRIKKQLQKDFPELFISCSSEILPEYKEYERGITTWLNAWVGPLVKGYLQRLAQAVQPAPLAIMQSSGGTIAAQEAADQAVRMLLSGPAGGLAGAKYISAQHTSVLTFDMGGTSTYVALIEGELQLTNEGHIGDYPVAVSMVDMHTIGAGGGSIAHIDKGGVLQVGPKSAGANPGPACYAQGGAQATVTDANLVLGRLSQQALLGGSLALNKEASQQAIAYLAEQLSVYNQDTHSTIEETALGIIQIANEHMTRALRIMSVQKGIDPKTLLLVPFGGAGALHVCALADNLHMSSILVPIHAGVLSAFGMVVAPHSRNLSKTINTLLKDIHEEQLQQQFKQLSHQGTTALYQDGIDKKNIAHLYSVDLRYAGQSYTLNIPWTQLDNTIKEFHLLHKKRYGHQHNQAIELVNIRVQISSSETKIKLPKLPYAINKANILRYETFYGIHDPVPVYQREQLLCQHSISGPALIIEQASTTWLAPNWLCTVDPIGNLLLNKNNE
jgi:N-methylhydantoinase A